MTRLVQEPVLEGFCDDRLLTWDVVQMLGAVCLVASARFTHEFIAGRQNDDAKQGDEEAKGGGNMPLAKDDAEVGRVPSK